MPFEETYITKTYDYRPKAKVTSEDYNNGFELLKAGANNATLGVVETKAALETVNAAIEALVEGTVPDDTITSEKIVSNSVQATHLNDDVFNKVSSLNYAQLLNANVAHMLYNHTPETTGNAYHNIYINKDPQLQKLNYTGNIINATQRTFAMTGSTKPSMSNPTDVTGTASIIEELNGPVIRGTSNKAGGNYILHVEYYQTYTPQIPFNNAKSIAFTPNSYAVQYYFLNDCMYEAKEDNQLYSRIVIKGVKDTVESVLYDSGNIFKIDTPITITNDNGALDYDSYKIFFTLNLKFNDDNWDYSYTIADGVTYRLGWYKFCRNKYGDNTHNFLFDVTGFGLFNMGVSSETDVVFDKVGSDSIVFKAPTKYISVSYKATNPLKVTLYADGLSEAIIDDNAILVSAGTYTHRIELEQPTNNAIVMFETTDASNIADANFTGYYIAG